jgi:hypothetical protein
VHVAAGNHEDAVAAGAMIAGEDVRRQVCAGELALVNRPVRIRPRYAQKNGLDHACSPPIISRDRSTVVKEGTHGWLPKAVAPAGSVPVALLTLAVLPGDVCMPARDAEARDGSRYRVPTASTQCGPLLQERCQR